MASEMNLPEVKAITGLFDRGEIPQLVAERRLQHFGFTRSEAQRILWDDARVSH
jgi:hypothetical protein